MHVNHLCSFQVLDIRPIHSHFVSRLQQVDRRHLAAVAPWLWAENANRHVGSWEKLRPKDALTLDLVKVISLFQISTSLAAKCTVAQAAMLAERNGRPTTAQTGAAQHTMRLH